jgi:hypothetical protein
VSSALAVRYAIGDPADGLIEAYIVKFRLIDGIEE